MNIDDYNTKLWRKFWDTLVNDYDVEKHHDMFKKAFVVACRQLSEESRPRKICIKKRNKTETASNVTSKTSDVRRGPKKPTSYNIFLKVMSSDPVVSKMKRDVKMAYIGSQWHNLSPECKAKYKEMANGTLKLKLLPFDRHIKDSTDDSDIEVEDTTPSTDNEANVNMHKGSAIIDSDDEYDDYEE